MTESATHVDFQHPFMRALGAAVFRLSEGDRVPALAIRLDQTEAIVPLEAISNLFGIERASPDGQLLLTIARALKFVPSLNMGDKLPSEVVTGEASWEPLPYHVQVATARLHMQLLQWIGVSGDHRPITSQMLVASIEDPSVHRRVQAALRRAATELGITGGGPAVASLIEQLAAEIAYIEALRDRLLAPVQAMAKRLNRMSQDFSHIAATRRETLLQVTRLATIGAAQIATRFDQVDAQTGEILSALRNLEQQRSFLRPHRDQLYCLLNEWETLLDQWDQVANIADDERLWRVIDRAYRFLAPRYMAVQEWQVSPPQRFQEKAKAVVW